MAAYKSNPGDLNKFGILLCVICNMCFAIRGVVTKKIKEAYPSIDNRSLFYHICCIGVVIQTVVVVLKAIMVPTFTLSGNSTVNLDVQTVLLNGVTFYLYLQLSWDVLGQTSVVTHSVLNSLRRPAIVVSAFVKDGLGKTTNFNLAGIVVACLGSLVYGHVKRLQAEAEKKSKSN